MKSCGNCRVLWYESLTGSFPVRRMWGEEEGLVSSTRRNVGAIGSTAAQAATTESAQRRTTPAEPTACGRRHFLRVEDRHPVEGATAGVGIRKQRASVLPTMARGRSLRGTLGGGPPGIRRLPAHSVEVAEYGWSDGESTTRWGKKPGQIRPIGRKGAPSARCLWTVPGCRSASPLMEPTSTTSGLSNRRWPAFPSSARNPPRPIRSTSVSTKATTTLTLVSWWRSTITSLISRRGARKSC